MAKKRKTKSSGEEGREEDEAPEEEVARRFTVFDFTLMSMTRHTGRRMSSSGERNAIAPTTPALVDD